MSDNQNNEDLKKKLQEQLKKFRGAEQDSPEFEKEETSSSSQDKKDNETSSNSSSSSSSSSSSNSSSSKNEGSFFSSFFNKVGKMASDAKSKRASSGNGSGGSNGGSVNGKALGLGAAVLVALGVLGATNFYTVNESEEGVVTRFGALSSVTKPGLNWKIPFIDKVKIVNVRRVEESRIEGTILTKDENVVNVELIVQYRIADPAAFLFNIDQPIKTIQEATESSLRYVVGHMNMDEVLTTGRSEVRQDTRTALENILDRYKPGIEIVDVNFQYARPPEEVKEAFDDAIKAQEDEQRYIREAEAYQRSQMPIARGQAEQIVAEAEGYARSVVTQAEGQQAYFNSLLTAYNKNPEIFKQRYYLDTIAYIYGNTPKVIMEKGANLNFLSLDKLLGPSTFQQGDSSTFSLLDPKTQVKVSKSSSSSNANSNGNVNSSSSDSSSSSSSYNYSNDLPSRFTTSGSDKRVGGK